MKNNVVAALSLAAALSAVAARAGDPVIYKDIIAPIIESKCVKCHGTEKAKGKLRMHTFEMIMKGGEDGKIVKPGDSAGSTMYKNLTLPAKDDDHMPPEEKPQPSAAQIAAIKWWIDKGASETMKVSEAGEVPADVKPLLEGK